MILTYVNFVTQGWMVCVAVEGRGCFDLKVKQLQSCVSCHPLALNGSGSKMKAPLILTHDNFVCQGLIAKKSQG